MEQYSARNLSTLSEEEIWKLPKETRIELAFDDGVIETTTERTMLSWYYWAVQRAYPDTPLKISHHIGSEDFSNKVHQSTIENVYKDWYFSHNDEYPPMHSDYVNDKENVWKVMYDDIHNAMYNAVIVKLPAHVATLSILDYMEVMEDPTIAKANASVKPDQKSIDKTYAVVSKALKTSPKLKKAMLSKMVRSKVVDIKQILQNISVRGFVTEINSRIYPIPILKGFAGGLDKLYESMIESRSASKALMFAKDPLAECEYFNRKLQLVCEVLDTLASGDCGSTITEPWKVEAAELESLSGVNYIVDGKLKSVSPSDTHLVGSIINIRTPWGCLHDDGQTVCETCFGQTSLAFPHMTNPGHVSAITLGEIISQLVLSTKHVDGSSTVDSITIPDEYMSYVTPGADDNSIIASADLIGRRVKMSVTASQASGLPGLAKNKVLDDDNYNIEKDSTMSSVILTIENEGDEEDTVVVVPTSMGTRLGSFSKQFLWYIKHNGFSLNKNGEYVVDMTAWLANDSIASNALFILPFKHTNMIDFKKEVENFILTSTTNKGLKSYKGDVVPALKGLLALINSRISINITHIMTIAYCMSVNSERDVDYAMPRAGAPFVFSTIARVMQGRSIGAMMPFERQELSFSAPESYVCRNRLRHPADEILLG